MESVVDATCGIVVFFNFKRRIVKWTKNVTYSLPRIYRNGLNNHTMKLVSRG